VPDNEMPPQKGNGNPPTRTVHLTTAAGAAFQGQLQALCQQAVLRDGVALTEIYAGLHIAAHETLHGIRSAQLEDAARRQQREGIAIPTDAAAVGRILKLHNKEC